MNSILIAMFVFICGLIVYLMHQINEVIKMQEDLREQLDEIHKVTYSRLNDIDRNVGILHTFLEEYTDTILKTIGSSNGDIDTISSYLEIMKNTILDMNEKMNKPVCGDEVNDTEEADLMPENWTDVSPTSNVYYPDYE